MDVIINNLISDAQAETFAYNIYRDVAEYMKVNFEEFLWWNLEEVSKVVVSTLEGIQNKKDNYVYEAVRY